MNPYQNMLQMKYPSLKPMNIPQFRGEVDERGLLLPFLVGAAVAFPIGYIASNTNKNNQNYSMPYQMPYQPYQPMMYQPYQPMPYYPYYPR